MPNFPPLISRKLKYNSPSGFININKYVPPFEKVKDGFGFIGVVIEDNKTGELQCNICGRWFKNLPTHINFAHKISANDYRKRFGLSQSTALKTKRLRLRQSAVMTKLNKENPKCFNRSHFGFEKKNHYAGNRKGKSNRPETTNKYGVCELQIIEKILDLNHKLKKTPTLIDIRNEYGFSFVTLIHQRYSSYIKLCHQLGLNPNFSNHYPKYSRKYFIKKALSKEPSLRIFTSNEKRAFYKYFPKGIKELKQVVQSSK
jgi:hypothetical protein